MGVPGPETLDAWLAQREATVPALRPDCAKHIRWAQRPGQVTEYAVVYVHGFSATGYELRPLPDLVADGLGANLYFARLAGHGQDGPALGRATTADWRSDVEEAIAVGHQIGRKLILMGCSTGCTLIASALAHGAEAQAVIFVSPNFGLSHPLLETLLHMPKIRNWGDRVLGPKRSFPAKSTDHAAYWTPDYPTQAVYTMAEAVAEVRRANLATVTVPAYVALNPADQVVSAKRTRAKMKNWGGRVQLDVLTQTANDDPMGHIMAGDVFSPVQTIPLGTRILAWLKRPSNS